ncbi:uncharacterized protein METZ01_LOCUS311471, partial [marine metagenome]
MEVIGGASVERFQEIREVELVLRETTRPPPAYTLNGFQVSALN